MNVYQGDELLKWNQKCRILLSILLFFNQLNKIATFYFFFLINLRYLLALNLSSTSSSILTFDLGFRFSNFAFLSASVSVLKSNGSLIIALGSWYRIVKVLPSEFTTNVLKWEISFVYFLKSYENSINTNGYVLAYTALWSLVIAAVDEDTLRAVTLNICIDFKRLFNFDKYIFILR